MYTNDYFINDSLLEIATGRVTTKFTHVYELVQEMEAILVNNKRILNRHNCTATILYHGIAIDTNVVSTTCEVLNNTTRLKQLANVYE